MDARYNEERYFGGKYVFGSAAPQLDIPKAKEQERPQERVRLRAAAKAVNSQGISVFAIAGWISAAVLAVAIIMSYIELNTVASQKYELKTELETLQTEETRLMITYESTFQLDEIEEYATNMLGMVRADSDQIKYLDNQAEDQAVVVDGSGAGTGVSAALKSFFTAAAEYFR